jgi:hypothetical protein
MKKLLLILALLFAGTTYAQSSVSVELGATYANGSLIAELLPASGGNVATTHIFLDANGSTTIGQATYQLTQNNSACFLSDNTNWITKDTITSASILPTNNQFTGTNSFGANVAFKGPSPYYDLTQYGLYTYVTYPPPTITCSITSGTNTASCGGGIADFAQGQGISIPLAGATPAFPTWGVSTISGFSRSANVATYSLAANTPVPGAGQTVIIAGMSDSTFNGTFAVTGNNGDFGSFFTANTGLNVSTTSSSGTATLTTATVAVTPVGILNGSTTYNYKIVMRGKYGELSVASPAGTTTTGATPLGRNTVSITSCSRTSGLSTCITRGSHNFQSGVSVDLEGTTQFSSTANQYNGVHMIVSTPLSTTFTFYQSDLGNDSGTDTGGTATVVAKNLVQWDMTPYIVMQSIVYRQIGAGAYSVVGIVEGMDGAFVDWGVSAPVVPGYVPSTPSSSVTNGILATTISSISGTTLTLAANATNTATSQTAQHDNTPIILNVCSALPTSGGGELRIPATSPIAQVPFNSPLNLHDNCTGNQFTVTLGSLLAINDPITLKTGVTFAAIPGGQSSGSPNQSYFSTSIFGNGYPFFYFLPGTFGPNTLTNLSMNCSGMYQSCVVQDQDQGGGGNANISYNNDTFIGIPGSMPFIMRGSFNFWFDRGGFYVNGGAWGVPEALQITVPNPLGGTDALTGNGFSMPGIMEFNKTQFGGHGIEINDWGQPHIVNQPGHVTFIEPLYENPWTPWMTVLLTGGTALINTTLRNMGYADFRSGSATPIILTSPGARIQGFEAYYTACASGNQPLFEGVPTAGLEVWQTATAGCSLIGSPTAIIHSIAEGAIIDFYRSASLEITGTGDVFYGMSSPAAPASAVVSSGGAVPIGAHTYQISAVDPAGGSTAMGPATSATTTTGNQTVTVTAPTLPPGAIGWRAYRDGGAANFPGCSSTPQAYIAATATFVDTFGYTCGGATPTVNTAGSSSLSTNGVATWNLTITPTNFANLGTPRNGTFLYCVDCVIANPCAGSGTGALAKRLNGIWVCN